MACASWLMNLGFAGGDGATDATVPDRPGLEYTLPTNRLHATLAENVLHATLRKNRLHYTLDEEDG